MEIGGNELIFTVHADTEVIRVAAELATAFWPDCVVVDDTDGAVQRGRTFSVVAPHERDEFFIFRDIAAHRSWEADGPTDANSQDLLHLIARRAPNDASSQEVTMVYYSNSESIRKLVEQVRNALTSPADRTPAVPSRR